MRQGTRLVRNTVLNLAGQVLPLVVAIFSLPPTIHSLGAERFGILSLAWVLTGYFSLFDLGLGRATTKFVSEAVSKGEGDRVPKIVWTSLAAQAIFGAIGGLALFAATPALAERILKSPPYLVGETRAVLYLLSASIPTLVSSRNLRGVLEAAQRFDLINAVRIPVGVLTFLIPLVGALMLLPVPAIVLALALLIVASSAAYFMCCLRVFPALRKTLSIDPGLVQTLLVFGGWVTVSNVLVPILLYLDRFLIGALVSVAALTYYTAPYEVASRLLIFPGALSTTLFPAFSALSVASRQDLIRLYVRSLKYVVLTLGPIVFVGVLFARDILQLWLGEDFAVKSSGVFQVLSMGMLLNAISQMPANLIDSVGRPDLRTKVFLSYVLVYAGLLWFLISRLGIVGAAVAWASRGGAECLIFIVVSAKLLRIGPGALVDNGLPHALAAYAGLVLVASVSLLLTDQRGVQAIATVLWLALFFLYIWKQALDDHERRSVFLGALRVGRRESVERAGT